MVGAVRSKLRVEFDGLNCLVPKRTEAESKAGRQAQEWLVVLPDVMKGFEPREGWWPRGVPPHVPALLVPAAQVIHASRTPALTYLDRTSKAWTHLYAFQRELLEVDYGHKSPLQAVLSDQLDRYDSSDPRNARDLYWAPPLAHMGLAGAGAFDRTHLGDDDSPNLGGERQEVAGVLRIGGGALYTDGVIASEGKPVVFDFKPADSEGEAVHSQEILEKLVWEDEAADVVTLRWSMDGGRSTGAVVLAPQRPGETVGLRVVNRELEILLGVGYATGTGDQDHDFAVAYRLSKAWPAIEKHSTAMPIPHARGQGEAGGSVRTCNPPSYSYLG